MDYTTVRTIHNACAAIAFSRSSKVEGCMSYLCGAKQPFLV